ncbi:gluconate 2-dehydrogenase subunit 3 family protein [Phenylobacterium sp. LjRoot225]|uniref:gluconate 2-dehydrogenase subunit 3 family protein n=1 Tax=Phenylobacterium sp. LjRoot225 TaxID=3342285 RepID=UPI003ECF6289
MTSERSRRGFLTGAGAIAAAAAALAAPARAAASEPPAPAAAPAPLPEPALILNATEMAFVTAAVDAFIPADELSPSGSACGVAVFIDRQLAGAYGAGARLYRDGPFLPGKPEHGYQLPLTPLEFVRAGIAAVNDWTRKTHGKPFDGLGEADRAAALKTLEAGRATLVGVDGAAFVSNLLELAMQGFFADPIYGGNRDKASWKMVGYPGLPATYAEAIKTYRGRRFDAEPQSIADFS